ncbi:CAP domain-containing protein [Nonomuraea antri]|uniref:CAP domain-containing protein n=1 Tax=Nonomuraea antri TaxID=2730852 RepID=UPI001F3C319C|nr:CAP domain-containing protein [Nonomuraea antri]
MRRPLQALACLGSLAAMSFPLPAAHAQSSGATRAAAPPVSLASSAAQGCRVAAAKPYVDARGVIRGTVSRAGCTDEARLRVRIKVSVKGTDPTVKSGSQIVRNARITAGLKCGKTPRRYYVVALDSKGRERSSSAVTLSCKSSGISAVEQAVVKLTNEARAKAGCRPLVHDTKLHKAAELHSADMAAKKYFDHTSKDGRDVADRITAAGFKWRSYGENIAMGQPTAASVVKGWLNSPGHRRNILDCGFTHIGVGHHAKGPVWTQDFASR